MALDMYVFGTEGPISHVRKLLTYNNLLELDEFSSYNLIDTKMTKRQKDGYENKAPSRR